jgi:hypothetical protein
MYSLAPLGGCCVNHDASRSGVTLWSRSFGSAERVAVRGVVGSILDSPLGSTMVSSPKISPARRRSIAVLNMSSSKSKSSLRRAYSIAPGDKLSPLSRSRRSLVRISHSLSQIFSLECPRNPGNLFSNDPPSHQKMLPSLWISQPFSAGCRLPRSPRFVYIIKTTGILKDQPRAPLSKTQNKMRTSHLPLLTTRMSIPGRINPALGVGVLCGDLLVLTLVAGRSLWNSIRRRS